MRRGAAWERSKGAKFSRNNMTLRDVRLIGLLLCVVLPGCGDGKTPATGTVTFDGQLVANGSVTFIGTDAAAAREGAVINDGKFTTTLPPGKYKVELNAQKVVGKRKQKGFSGEIEELEITEELFPERYNSKSDLYEEIKPGQKEIKLDLKSKP